MKQFLLSMAFAGFVFGAQAQGPQLSVDKEVHDYGNIPKGANGTCEFVVTNTGDQPLIITNC